MAKFFLLYLTYSGYYFCYWAAPWPTLGHFQGDSLTNPMLITAYFNYFDPKVTKSLATRLGTSDQPST